MAKIAPNAVFNPFGGFALRINFNSQPDLIAFFITHVQGSKPLNQPAGEYRPERGFQPTRLAGEAGSVVVNKEIHCALLIFSLPLPAFFVFKK